jgi:hypothetical protein
VQKEGRLTILDSRWPSPAGAGFSSWEEAGLLLGCAVLHTDKLVAGSNIAQDLIFLYIFGLEAMASTCPDEPFLGSY